jgi:uroporphyrinogen decarboxylase
MNRRERFAKAMNHEATDRVLSDFGKYIGSMEKAEYLRMKEYLKGDIDLKNENIILDPMAQNVQTDEELLQRFNVDFRWVQPNLFAGTKQISETEYVDMWGVTFQYSGGYWAVSANPLKEGTIEELEKFNWPDPNTPGFFDGIDARAKHFYEDTDYIVGADGIKNGLLMTAAQMRGYETFLMDLISEPEYAAALLDKLLDIMKKMWSIYLGKVGKYVQLVMYNTDDYGTQNSLLVSPEIFRTFLKGRNKDLIDHVKSMADVKVMLHSDGAILPLIDDFVEMGVDILNPMQTSLEPLSDLRGIKEKYGDRISFHGGIDVQHVMQVSTPAEIKKIVHKHLYELGKDGGYIIAVCHNISHMIPPENIIALFEAVQEHGEYPVKPYQ